MSDINISELYYSIRHGTSLTLKLGFVLSPSSQLSTGPQVGGTSQFGPPSNELPRLAAFDGLRGVAACIVLFHHISWSNHFTNTTFFANGYVAVDLFFVLSGVVIARKYLPTVANGSSAYRYLGLRLFRIYPLHLFVLLGLLLFECLKLILVRQFGFYAGESPPFTATETPYLFFVSLFLVQSFNSAPVVGWNGPSWSISGEMLSYALFAAIPLLRLHRIGGAAGALALTAGLGYAWIGYQSQYSNMTSEWGFVRALAGFAAGVSICLIQPRSNSIIRAANSWHLDILMGLLWVFIVTTMKGPFVYAAVGPATLIVVLVMDDRSAVARVLCHRIPQFFGRISYSIYMVQAAIIVLLVDFIRYTFGQAPLMSLWAGDLLVVALFVLSIAVALGTYKFIEIPGRRLGRKLFSQSTSDAEITESREAISSARAE